MAEVRPDVAYTVLAVDELIEREPERAGGVLHEVMAGVGDGAPAPLPLAVRPVTEAAAAMETMRAGRHVGKLVLTMPGLSGGRLRSAGPYLVSGGLGGLGLEVARWLIARGVRTIVLNARTAPDPATAAAIEAMREQGATVRVELADVADEAAVAAMLEKLARDLPPLAGVFHCAGVLADGALENQDPGRFERVLGPKTFGAWNLHCATRHLDLDHFVMFSSVAGVMGNPGQANYAAPTPSSINWPTIAVRWGWPASRSPGGLVGRRDGRFAPGSHGRLDRWPGSRPARDWRRSSGSSSRGRPRWSSRPWTGLPWMLARSSGRPSSNGSFRRARHRRHRPTTCQAAFAPRRPPNGKGSWCPFCRPRSGACWGCRTSRRRGWVSSTSGWIR